MEEKIYSNQSLEDIKHIDENGIEFWYARELQKVLDYKERNGYHMCVGCGRCDDICPEYISFSNCVNKLENGMKELNSPDNNSGKESK